MSKTNTKADIDILADEINKLSTDLGYNLIFQLNINGLLIDRLFDIESRKIGHNKKQHQILSFLIVHGGTAKATDLSRELFKSKQLLTIHIDGLEKEGLIVRNSKNKDRRVKDIVITKKGIEEIKKALPLTLKMFNDLIPKFTDKKTQALTNDMIKIKKHLMKKLYT